MVYTFTVWQGVFPFGRRRADRQPPAAARPRQAARQPIKVGPGEAPGERGRGLLTAVLEDEQAGLDLGKVSTSWGVRTSILCAKEANSDPESTGVDFHRWSM